MEYITHWLRHTIFSIHRSREKRYEQEFLANKSEIDNLKKALQEAQLDKLRISEDIQDGERRLGGAREASGLYSTFQHKSTVECLA